MADFIETNPLTGFKISGIVAQTQFIPIELKKLRRSSLESALTMDKIDVIIQTDSKNVSEHYQIAQKHYLDFYQAPEFDGIMTTKHTIDIIDSVPLIHTHPTPLMGYGRIVKRIMDINRWDNWDYYRLANYAFSGNCCKNQRPSWTKF